MSRSPRHDKILQLVRENGFMPIEELARLLDVTPQTIRRDINQLCEANLLRRYHGGAALGNSVENEDYFSRKGKLQSEKAHIADMIAENIPDHASLFMSIGTTIEAVAQALTATHKGLRVITNNIHVASIMSANPDFTVMITSGVVRASDGGITGVATLDFINQFKVDYAVIGVSGIETDGSLLDFDYREVRVAQAMMNNARHRFLAADHSKFGRNALVRMGHISEFNAIFTDAMPPESLKKLLEDHGVRMYLADPL
ncbi:DeoR/GlpR family DNA-binding transcription regulator [Vogesella facilis]|uniref:DeoR/GlpR family DNA-binding transcription regulator n=1 Tax=Vogesella facilis TaxID=1655232 RepID=A0ABV7RHB1_9NEIS